MWVVCEIYGSVVQKLIIDFCFNMDLLCLIFCKFYFKIVQFFFDNKLGKFLYGVVIFLMFLCNIRFKDFI